MEYYILLLVDLMEHYIMLLGILYNIPSNMVLLVDLKS